MHMQRVQLDISSDIFDKVISFLESLPKSKIRLHQEKESHHTASQTEKVHTFSDFLNHSQRTHNSIKFDRDALHAR